MPGRGVQWVGPGARRAQPQLAFGKELDVPVPGRRFILNARMRARQLKHRVVRRVD